LAAYGRVFLPYLLGSSDVKESGTLVPPP
jgi:hypothetical protein